jgi:hypothetical protein
MSARGQVSGLRKRLEDLLTNCSRIRVGINPAMAGARVSYEPVDVAALGSEDELPA